MERFPRSGDEECCPTQGAAATRISRELNLLRGVSVKSRLRIAMLRRLLLCCCLIAQSAALVVLSPRTATLAVDSQRELAARAGSVQLVSRTPEEIANMKKWGKILSQSDTFDGDYLKKNRMRKSDESDASLDSNGEKIVAAGSAVVLIGLLAVAASGQ